MLRNLSDEQLEDTLISQGILDHSDYEKLVGQATERTV